MDSPLTESGQWTESGISTGSAARPKAEKPRDLDIGGSGGSKGESGAGSRMRGGADWPPEWKEGLIIPLWKQKGSRTDKNTWRGSHCCRRGVNL